MAEKSNVTSITASKPRTAPKLPKAELFEQIIKMMNGEDNPVLPHFPEEFRLIEPKPGVKRLLLVGANEVVQYCTDFSVQSAILNYCRDALLSFAEYRKFTSTTAKECANDWMLRTTSIEVPPSVKEKSEPGLCFHRLPFDMCEGPTPIFDEFLSRCDNADALCQFIGSLFDGESDRQQYFWLHGSGQNGKGSLMRFLRKALGDAALFTTPPSRDNRFWNECLLGKRLVMFSDCDDFRFPVSQDFKILTGGDYVRIEPKGKPAYDAEIEAKFMFGSNEMPAVTRSRADRRRALYCEIEPIAGESDPNYDKKLWIEAPHILHKARVRYKEACPAHTVIKGNTESLYKVIEQNEGRWALLATEFFKREPSTKYSAFNESPSFNAKQLACVCRAQKLSMTEKNEFLRYLQDKYDLDVRVVKLPNGKTERRYIGIHCILFPEFA